MGTDYNITSNLDGATTRCRSSGPVSEWVSDRVIGIKCGLCLWRTRGVKYGGLWLWRLLAMADPNLLRWVCHISLSFCPAFTKLQLQLATPCVADHNGDCLLVADGGDADDDCPISSRSVIVTIVREFVTFSFKMR